MARWEAFFGASNSGRGGGGGVLFSPAKYYCDYKLNRMSLLHWCLSCLHQLRVIAALR